MKDKKEFGQFIQTKRKSKGYSQAEFASLLYVTESAVSKWERGISYPDITMISDICQLLDINEHEFLTASNDFEYRKMKKDAKKFHRLSNSYFYSLVVVYGIAIVACLITNLAVNHTLSWFFIAFFAMLTGFSLIPSFSRFTQNHKFLMVSGTFLSSLTLLLLTCNIYTNGNWFLMAIIGVLLGYSIIIIPIYIRKYNLPAWIKKRKFIVCITLDVIILILLLGVIALTNHGNWFLVTLVAIIFCYAIFMTPLLIKSFDLPKIMKKHVGLFSVAIDYILFILLLLIVKICNHGFLLIQGILVATYTIIPIICTIFIQRAKINKYFKIALNSFIWSAFVFYANFIFGIITGIGSSYEVNLWDWSLQYVNGNSYLSILIIGVFISLLFLVIGIFKYYEKKEESLK